MKKYYLATVKCGHVGRKMYIPITFPIKAESGKEAAKIARTIPRVKRHHWDAILSCIEVDEISYDEQLAINNNDPYLSIHSRHEQNAIMEFLMDRLLVDKHQEEIERKTKRSNRPNLYFQSKKYNYNELKYTI